MLRADLLGMLRSVAPALAAKPMVPVLDHLCFTGEHVIAYDDVVALKAPCGLDFEGAVSGSRLLALVASSKAEKVECTEDGKEVVFKLGRTKARFAFLPPGDFLFQEPSRKGNAISLDDDLRRGFDIAARSASKDVADGIRYGITLVFEKKKLTLYASDNVTVIRVVMSHKVPGLAGMSVVLTERFYGLLGKMADANLVFTEAGDALAVSDGLELFGKVRQGTDPGQFDKVFAAVGLDKLPRADVPASLARCLDRALIVSKEITEFGYADGRLNMLTVDQGCEVRDSVKIDLGGEPFEVCTCAEYIKRFLDVADRIGFGPKCIVLEGVGFQVLVGVKAKK